MGRSSKYQYRNCTKYSCYSFAQFYRFAYDFHNLILQQRGKNFSFAGLFIKIAKQASLIPGMVIHNDKVSHVIADLGIINLTSRTEMFGPR